MKQRELPEIMMARWMRIALLAGLASAFATAASAQQTVRVSGTVASIDGQMLAVTTRQGEVKVNLTPDVEVFGVVKKTLADIKPGTAVGAGTVPQPDGSHRAVRINIFPPGQLPNEGQRPWEGAPQGTMTNATVDASVASVDGHVLTVKYKGSEQKMTVTPETLIITPVRGDKSELKPGADVLIIRAAKKPDGTLEASRVNVGRDGVVPQ